MGETFFSHRKFNLNSISPYGVEWAREGNFELYAANFFCLRFISTPVCEFGRGRKSLSSKRNTAKDFIHEEHRREELEVLTSPLAQSYGELKRNNPRQRDSLNDKSPFREDTKESLDSRDSASSTEEMRARSFGRLALGGRHSRTLGRLAFDWRNLQCPESFLGRLTFLHLE